MSEPRPRRAFPGLLTKFYLWFLLALTLTLVATAIAWQQFGRSTDERLQALAYTKLALARDVAELVLEDENSEQELRRIMLPQLVADRASLAIVSASGEVLVALPNPEFANLDDILPTAEERRQTLANGELIRLEHRAGGVLALPIQTPDGRAIYYLSVHQGVWGPSRTWGGILSFLVLLAVGWLVCWPLAAHLSRPLRRLAAVAEQLGRGNLQARIDLVRGDEVGRLASHFNTMAERLQGLVEGQKRLLADVSHELRSPLARLRVALELVRQDTEANLSPHLQRAEAQADNLEAMIDELLTYSRLELKPYELVREEVELGEVVAGVMGDQRAMASERGIHLTQDGLAGLPPVFADPKMLSRALSNVIANALAVAPEGSTVSIRATSDNGRIELTVADRGPGVPADLLDAIFAPFFRVDAARSRNRGGVGLGLAIVRRCMESHAGGARAELRANGGLRMVLWLPV